MIINTKRFGKLQVEDNEILTFVSPILGFPDLKRYVLIKQDDNPFEFLQSSEDEDLTFIVIEPFEFSGDYEFNLESHWVESLAINCENDIDVKVLVTVRSSEDITYNLRAPILINHQNNRAAQIILEHGDYSTRHPFLVEPKGENGRVDIIEK
ncbi:flagellar assembly protein FliW [Paenibacillus sp. NPDC058910]|uniref:flagellar assembly protein FliW n=1 Tax=unclassified Paenibacillus TaxID=185978 RepID=UPI00369A49C4